MYCALQIAVIPSLSATAHCSSLIYPYGYNRYAKTHLMGKAWISDRPPRQKKEGRHESLVQLWRALSNLD